MSDPAIGGLQDDTGEALHAGGVLEKTARGTGWIVGWRMSTRLLGLVNTLILVRLLLPSDFGLVALGSSFAQAIESMGYIGLQDSLIREKHVSRGQYDTAFTLGLLRSACTAALVAALAFPAGAFFHEPRMAPVTLALAAGMVIDGLGNIGQIDFRRDFAFRKEFVLWVIPRIAAIIASISVALIWRSYWAMIAGILVQRVLRVVLSYIMHPFRPRLHIGAWRSMIGYSLWAWVISLISVVRDRTATILIGRMLGATSVGIFSLGYELAAMPTTELVEPLGRAAFSGFSATRNAGLPGGDVFLRMVASMALITMPMGVGMALVADPVVRLAFGPRWGAAIPLVQMLGLCGALTVFGSLGSVLFRVYGQQRLVVQVSAAVEVARVLLLILLTRRYGLMGAGAATAVAFGIEQLYVLHLARTRFHIGVRRFVARLCRPVLAVAAMAAALIYGGLTVPLPAGAAGLQLALHGVLAALAGGLVYAASLFVFWQVAGRPDGAEEDVLTFAGRTLRPLMARLRR